MKPSNFTSYPWSSVLRKSECEIVAQNIMNILKRTGDEFRELTYQEYELERKKDGKYSIREKDYFDKVILYCQSAEEAVRFSKFWEPINE